MINYNGPAHPKQLWQVRSEPIPAVNEMPDSFVAQTELACRDLANQSAECEPSLLEACV